MSGVLAPLPRVRLISHITLELFGAEAHNAKVNRPTFPNLRAPPSQIR